MTAGSVRGNSSCPVVGTDPRPSGHGGFGDGTVDRAEPGPVVPVEQGHRTHHQVRVRVVECVADLAQVRDLSRLCEYADGPHVPLVAHTEKHRTGDRLGAQFRGGTEHQCPVRHGHLSPSIHLQEFRVRPPRAQRVLVGAKFFGALDDGARQEWGTGQRETGHFEHTSRASRPAACPRAGCRAACRRPRPRPPRASRSATSGRRAPRRGRCP